MQEIKKAYAILCGAASDALDALPELPENVRGRWILENALSKAEQLICDDDKEIKRERTALSIKKKEEPSATPDRGTLKRVLGLGRQCNCTVCLFCCLSA